MPDMHHYLAEALQRLGRQPESADDIVVMVSDVLYDRDIGTDEALLRLAEIINSPLALQIYDNEMPRRNPRDADRWH